MYGSSSFTNGNSTYCLSCNASMFLLGASCLSDCPSGYYSSGAVCELCMSNCLNCTAAATCTSCQFSYSLYNSACVYTCPASTVSVYSNVSNSSTCIPCPSDCLSCSSAASPLCLNCLGGFYLYNGSCVSNCSFASLFISYQMSCAACQCLNCTTFAFNCT